VLNEENIVPKEIIYCPKCHAIMKFDRIESSYLDLENINDVPITWDIYKCPMCGFESFRRKY